MARRDLVNLLRAEVVGARVTPTPMLAGEKPAGAVGLPRGESRMDSRETWEFLAGLRGDAVGSLERLERGKR